MIMGEISLLLLTTSSQAGVVSAALQGLKAIANAEGHPDSPAPRHFSSEDQAKRWPVYEQLGEEKTVLGTYLSRSLDKILTRHEGRVVQQKRIRKLLRHIAFPCTTHQVVWEESCRRFFKIDKRLKEENTDISVRTREQSELRQVWNLLISAMCIN